MGLRGVYHTLVQTQEDGNVEVIEEEIEAGQEQNNNYHEVSDIQPQDDATRASFLTASKQSRRISQEAQTHRSAARMSR